MERTSPLACLSDRELEVLALVAEGLSNDAIARRLIVSARTIETITASVFRKLDLIDSGESNRRVQAAVLYVRHAPDIAGVTSLPSRATSLVGRAAEQADLRRLLERHRYLTISGPGGAGKTTLATALGASWARDGKRLRFVDLVKVRRSDLVVEEAISAFGVVAKDPKAGLRRVKSYIGANEFLVVLDNADDVAAGVVALVDELLTMPGVRIVVTSRSPTWSPHEHLWIAPPMTLHDSEALLYERCPVPVDAAAVRRICIALDGLPLAIELVASRLATAPADQVLASLSSRLPDVLVSHSDGRHSSLRRALLPSYEDLANDARFALQTLAVLPAGFTADAVASLLGATVPSHDARPPGAPAVLETLVQASFVSFDGRRFRLLEPIRQFALGLIGAAEGAGIADLHAGHWGTWSKTISAGVLAPDQSMAYAMLAAEQANVEAAVRFLVHRGAVEPALRIVSRLAYPWSVSGNARALDVALHVLDASAGTVADRWRGRAMATIGGLGSLLASPMRDWEVMLTEATELLRACGDDTTLAAACYSLSRHRLTLGRIDEAIDGIDDAIDLASRTGQHWLHGWSLVNKATLLIERRADASVIVDLLDQAEALGRRAALPVVRAGALMRKAALVILEERDGRPIATPAQRHAWADEAERIMRASGHLWQLHEVVFLQCRSRLHDGDLRAASTFAAEAIAVAARCESAPIFAEAVLMGAELALRSGNSEAAERLTEIAASVTPTIWNRRWLGTHDSGIRECFERLTDSESSGNTARSGTDAHHGLDPDLDAAASRALAIVKSAT